MRFPLLSCAFTGVFTVSTALLAAGAAPAPTQQNAPTTMDEKAKQTAIEAIDAAKLSRGDLSEAEYAFKQQVYRLHVARGVNSGRTRVFDLPPSQLALIPGTEILMQRDAALHLGQLLDAARADLKRDLALQTTEPALLDRQKRARRVEALGINNAYRSASRQFGIWDRNFAGYLAATREERAKCVGGEFGSNAAELLREYIGVRVAAPGFSNHQGGIAVDFALKLRPDDQKGDKELSASMAQTDPWKESWFWRWLKVRAGEFGFVEYAAEPWHWEYKPQEAQKTLPKP